EDGHGGGTLARRLTGSSDIFDAGPLRGVNFITAHDGFTLADLVAYDHKHNEANNEDNRDGESHNRSWNSGCEGPTDDPAVLAVRATRRRSMLATLFLSQGVPMLLGGDEIGRTQGGNNNAYAQDNEVSWFDWDHGDHELLQFVERITGFRREHPVFRRRRWFEGRPIHGADVHDMEWFRPDGSPMIDDDWAVGYARSLAVFLNGHAITTTGPRGERIDDDSFLLMFNADADPIDFVVPNGLGGSRWVVELDTADAHHVASPTTAAPVTELVSNAVIELSAWAVVVLRRLDGTDRAAA
ncbi:MAG: glycogen debranching enzyme, partial [Acidimicrobiia bacterium]|nr:glycogen debranching enzyme [Acidimicrobiia bacterium]